MKKLYYLAAALIIALSLAACKTTGNEDNASSAFESLAVSTVSFSELSETVVPAVNSIPDEPVYVKVEEIKLSAYEKTLNIGERFMPIVTMLPENASNKAEIWESDNTAVATVNKYGNITALSLIHISEPTRRS